MQMGNSSAFLGMKLPQSDEQPIAPAPRPSTSIIQTFVHSLSPQEWAKLYTSFLTEEGFADPRMERLDEFKTQLMQELSKWDETSENITKCLDLAVRCGRQNK